MRIKIRIKNTKNAKINGKGGNLGNYLIQQQETLKDSIPSRMLNSGRWSNQLGLLYQTICLNRERKTTSQNFSTDIAIKPKLCLVKMAKIKWSEYIKSWELQEGSQIMKPKLFFFLHPVKRA